MTSEVSTFQAEVEQSISCARTDERDRWGQVFRRWAEFCEENGERERAVALRDAADVILANNERPFMRGHPPASVPEFPVLSRLYALEAEYLQTRGWKPYVKQGLPPGNNVYWMSSNKRHFVSQEVAVFLQQNLE